jgi:GNAT superfamily N-acetyltransferase
VIDVRVLTRDDWALWREVRLAALTEAPQAFGAALADHQGDRDRPEGWQARLELAGSCNLVAHVGDRAVGMAGGVPTDDTGVVELISMWVAPAARGLGVGVRLIEAIEQWATRRGATALRLTVVEDNAPAADLYRRAGFAPSGAPITLMPDGVRREVVLEKVLR